mgnify:CR=1 FL=1
MIKSSFKRAALVGASSLLAAGLAACGTATRLSRAGGAEAGIGQQSAAHAPQGETGTPHGHSSASVVSGPGGSAAMGASRAHSMDAQGFGQHSSQNTPQGETGVPHPH